jgi:hypothetical protein
MASSISKCSCYFENYQTEITLSPAKIQQIEMMTYVYFRAILKNVYTGFD